MTKKIEIRNIEFRSIVFRSNGAKEIIDYLTQLDKKTAKTISEIYTELNKNKKTKYEIGRHSILRTINSLKKYEPNKIASKLLKGKFYFWITNDFNPTNLTDKKGTILKPKKVIIYKKTDKIKIKNIEFERRVTNSAGAIEIINYLLSLKQNTAKSVTQITLELRKTKKLWGLFGSHNVLRTINNLKKYESEKIKSRIKSGIRYFWISNVLKNSKKSNSKNKQPQNSITITNKRVSPLDLKKIFINSFAKIDIDFMEDDNPFLFKVFGLKFYVFLKNISPAYYVKYPDISRVQLPYSDHFKKISKSDFPFVILGYNSNYETFTAWNPFDIKSRLNQKSNVSLFTRDSFQEFIRLNMFKEKFISNGDKVILFDSRSLPMFFNNYITLFTININKRKIKYIKTKDSKNESEVKKGDLTKIEDLNMLKDLIPYQVDSNVLGAVLMCSEKYASNYPDMTIGKWTKLVTNYFQKKDIYLIK